MRFIKAHGRFGVAVLALAIAFVLSVRFSDRGVQFDLRHTTVAATEKKGGDYDLTSLKILNRVLLQIKDNYVEPDRIDPNKMLVSSLDEIQNSIAEVVVEFDKPLSENPTEVTLTVAYLIVIRFHSKAGPWSALEMARHLQLSQTAVSDALELLLHTDFIRATNEEPPRYLPSFAVEDFTVLELRRRIRDHAEEELRRFHVQEQTPDAAPLVLVGALEGEGDGERRAGGGVLYAVGDGAPALPGGVAAHGVGLAEGGHRGHRLRRGDGESRR